MQEIINLTALDTEVFTTAVTGIGNFSSYIDERQLASGDELEIAFYVDVVGTGDRVNLNTVSVTYEDNQLFSDQGDLGVPVTLEADQTFLIGIKITSGNVPLAIPVRVSNIQEGT